MKNQRPVNLNLFQFHFPVMAIISILHRISGVVIFLALPILLCFLHSSLQSEYSFMQVMTSCHSFGCRLMLWLIVVALIYHFLAGIRHLMMDFGVGDSVPGGRLSAYFVLAFTAVLSIIAGIWIW